MECQISKKLLEKKLKEKFGWIITKDIRLVERGLSLGRLSRANRSCS